MLRSLAVGELLLLAWGIRCFAEEGGQAGLDDARVQAKERGIQGYSSQDAVLKGTSVYRVRRWLFHKEEVSNQAFFGPRGISITMSARSAANKPPME